MMHDERNKQSIDSRSYVIHHNTQTAVQPLKLPDRRRFENIEHAKQNKCQQYIPELSWQEHQRDKLPGYFINHNMAGVFFSAFFLHDRRSRNTCQHDNGRCD